MHAPMRDNVLVVGAGQAGLQLATSLRELGHEGRIALAGADARAPYQRPPLSKGYLTGVLSEDRLALRSERYYAERAIDLHTDEEITSVAIDDPSVGGGRAVSAAGREFPFDRLALTVGGSPRRLTVPGVNLPGVHYLRTVADSNALRADVAQARRVVVIGGGFIGLEVAASATASGKQVTVLEATDRLLSRVVAPATSRFYADAHRARGTVIELGAVVAAITGHSRVTAVELADGRQIRADVVLIGIGMVPHTELAKRAGLACAGGIVVDGAARTSAHAVVAAGDCAVRTQADGRHLHVESVQNAISQAKLAAATILGIEVSQPAVPWFWSDQHDLKLQIAGLNIGYDHTVVRGDPVTESFSVLYYRGHQLISIDAINRPRDYIAVRRILDSGGTVPDQAAADTSTPLKDFLTAPA